MVTCDDTRCRSNVKVKVKEVDLYSAFIVVPHIQRAQVRITQFLPENYTVSCLYLVSVHQMAPTQTEAQTHEQTSSGC